MKIKIINRKYLIGGKSFRFEKMIGLKTNSIGLVGWKIAIGKYELRIYKK